MLTVTAETHARFAEIEEQRFISRISAFLRQAVPGLAKEPEPAMHATIRHLRADARTFDMTSEQAVAAYALTAGHLGIDFPERFRGARQILYSNRSQEEKADLLKHFTKSLLQTLGRR